MIDGIKKKKEKFISSFIKKCSHNFILEGEHKESLCGNGNVVSPCVRVCSNCGLMEEGWTFFDLENYERKDREIRKVSREYALENAIFFRRREEVIELLYQKNKEI